MQSVRDRGAHATRWRSPHNLGFLGTFVLLHGQSGINIIFRDYRERIRVAQRVLNSSPAKLKFKLDYLMRQVFCSSCGSINRAQTCKDCKVISGEHLSTKYRLLFLNFKMKGWNMKNKLKYHPKITWGYLKNTNENIFENKP